MTPACQVLGAMTPTGPGGGAGALFMSVPRDGCDPAQSMESVHILDPDLEPRQ